MIKLWENVIQNILIILLFLNSLRNGIFQNLCIQASLGMDEWNLLKKEKEIPKCLLKNLTGISVREKGSAKTVKKHLEMK